MLFTLFCLQFSCPTIQPNELSISHTCFKLLSTVSLRCLFYKLSISNFVICSTQFYRVTKALELSKFFNPSQRRISVHSKSRVYFHQYMGWVQVIIERILCEMLNGFWEYLFSLVVMYRWTSQYISLTPQLLSFIKRDMNFNLYIVQVIAWWPMLIITCTYALIP